MRQFQIAFAPDQSNSYGGRAAKWIDQRSRPVCLRLFLELLALTTMIDFLVDHAMADILYIFPIVLCCWTFKAKHSAMCTGLIISVKMIKQMICDQGTALNITFNATFLLISFFLIAFLTVAFRDLFDHVQTLAIYDELTGLLNRAAFDSRAEQALVRARAQGNKLLFLVFDIDGFKSVNDSEGHAAGDALLHDFSAAASRGLPYLNIFGRTGGDEFAAAMELKASDDGARMVQAIHVELSSALRQAGFGVTCSLGAVTTGPTQTEARDDLFRLSDALLYSVKRRGKNGFRHIYLNT